VQRCQENLAVLFLLEPIGLGKPEGTELLPLQAEKIGLLRGGESVLALHVGILIRAMPDRRGGGLHRGYYMAGKTVKKPGADHLFPPGPGRLRRVISPITQYGPKIPCPERGVGSRQVRAGIRSEERRVGEDGSN